MHPGNGGMTTATIKPLTGAFVLPAYGRKFKPPALRVVADTLFDPPKGFC